MQIAGLRQMRLALSLLLPLCSYFSRLISQRNFSDHVVNSLTANIHHTDMCCSYKSMMF